MNLRRLTFLPALLLAGIFFGVFCAPCEAESQTASAGWAEAEITPPLGISLGGRGTPETHANKILDPLYAQVLYLKDANGAGMVVVSFDLIGMSHDLGNRIRNSIVQELGVEYNLVVLNCSHTHSGPYMFRELMAGIAPQPQNEIDYFNALANKIVSATRAAKKSLTPVKVEVFEGTSKVAINRRGRDKTGHPGIIPNPNGPIAEKVWVMKLSPVDKSAPAVVFSYACHPVIVYEYEKAAISADFPGVTRNALREALGEKSHVQFVQGLAGDVRPRVLADIEHNRFRAPTPADKISAGKELAGDVLKALEGKGKKLDLNLAGTMDRPFLPRGNPPPRAIYETMATNKSEFQRSVAKYWLERYDSGEGFARGDALPVGLIRLAKDQWVWYSAGEPCVEWGPLVAKWLAPRNVVMWGYCQQGLSYIPTEEMLPEGGYEVNDSNRARASTPAAYAPGINEAVRKSVLRQAAFIDAKVK
jgi:hypothetical protein